MCLDWNCKTTLVRILSVFVIPSRVYQKQEQNAWSLKLSHVSIDTVHGRKLKRDCRQEEIRKKKIVLILIASLRLRDFLIKIFIWMLRLMLREGMAAVYSLLEKKKIKNLYFHYEC